MKCPNADKEVRCSDCKEMTSICEPCCPGGTRDCDECAEREYDEDMKAQLADSCNGGSSQYKKADEAHESLVLAGRARS